METRVFKVIVDNGGHGRNLTKVFTATEKEKYLKTEPEGKVLYCELESKP